MQALRNEPITIYGDGEQSRSFCYVDDLVEGALRLMVSPDDVTGPINVGNPNEFTIRQLAEAVIRLLNSKSELIRLPLPQDDPRQRRPDITKAREILRWEPTIQLDEGLLKTINYFDNLVKTGV
jgi:UDP-glucuronate decarboxylase